MIEAAPFKEVDPFQDGGGGVHGDPDNVTDPTEVAQTVWNFSTQLKVIFVYGVLDPSILY